MSSTDAAVPAEGTGQRPRRILAVCLGNHCRSPVAAAVLARRGGEAVEVRSAGLLDRWVGRAAHPGMIAAAAARGYDLTGHRGTLISPELLEWADTVLAMDHSVLEALRSLADEHTSPKLGLYLDGGRDVPDPWGRPDEAFTACVSLIEQGAERHLR
ncbi:low molecular weight protein-tyrosine-phosphatase [Kitasatospora sp. HPMI-4]|uniref:low molecular weight protein-tyrosine-phosphatase n=1 Tax=Kitasatospora sp. HPMI-4 TaxID=3448443 RepID=UPI003F1C7F1B